MLLVQVSLVKARGETGTLATWTLVQTPLIANGTRGVPTLLAR